MTGAAAAIRGNLRRAPLRHHARLAPFDGGSDSQFAPELRGALAKRSQRAVSR